MEYIIYGNTLSYVVGFYSYLRLQLSSMVQEVSVTYVTFSQPRNSINSFTHWISLLPNLTRTPDNPQHSKLLKQCKHSKKHFCKGFLKKPNSYMLLEGHQSRILLSPSLEFFLVMFQTQKCCIIKWQKPLRKVTKSVA